ncbi:MAG: hypothetical protein V2A66_08300 [Pseudomonadota bacterium]
MFAGGFPDQPPDGSVKSVTAPFDPGERVAQITQLVEQGQMQIQEAEQQVAEAFKQQPFEVAKQLPQFLQAVAKKLDASTAFQQFRLPGTDRVVSDRREGPEHGKPQEAQREAAKKGADDKKTDGKGRDAAGEMHLKDGRLIKHRERTYENYLGDRGAGRGGLDAEAAGERVERMMSAFERMVLERFEGGRQVASESPDGKPKFLEKSAAQWREFFKMFFDRTVQKKVLLSDIRDFLLRGLISKGEKGIVISDMRLENGRAEKFVRFSILAEALAKLKGLLPGDAFDKGMLGKLSGEELMYLALAVSRGRRFAAAMLPMQGKFVGGRAEAMAAEALGLPLAAHLSQKAKGLRARHGGFGDDGPADDLPYQFIPWWRWGNLKRPGRFKWVTAAFYGTLLILSIIGVVAITYRILSGQ